VTGSDRRLPDRTTFTPMSVYVLRITSGLAGLSATLCALAIILAHGLKLGAGDLLFETNRAGNWDIVWLDVATGRTIALMDGAHDENGPSWSFDGQWIAFSADVERDLLPEIYVMDVSGRDVRLVVGDNGSNRRPAWTPDNRSIIFMRNYRRIRQIELETGFEEEIASGFSPVWSPDGRYLAFYDDPDGRLNNDIFVFDRLTGRLYNVTAYPGSDWSPAWSPDGAWLAFASRRDGSTDIYLLDAGCLASDAGIASCRSSVRRLTTHPGSDYDPAWSPDGARLAYVSEQAGQFQLRVIDADGSNDRLLFAGPGINQYPRWRPR